MKCHYDHILFKYMFSFLLIYKNKSTEYSINTSLNANFGFKKLRLHHGSRGEKDGMKFYILLRRTASLVVIYQESHKIKRK